VATHHLTSDCYLCGVKMANIWPGKVFREEVHPGDVSLVIKDIQRDSGV